MKKFFRLVMVFVLTGATLAYTGCTDFSEDIKAVNDRVDQISGNVDKLVSGDVATIQTQIANMQSTISALESAKTDASSAIENLKGRTSTLEGQVVTLQTKASDLEKNLATLTSDLNAVNKALDNLKSDTNKQIDEVKASVAELKSQLASEKVALETKIASVENELSKVKADLAAVQTVANTNKENITVLQGKVENIEKTIITMNASIEDLKANKADKTWVEATFATLEQINAANESIIALKAELVAVNARVDAAESRISAAEARLNNIDAYHKEIDATISDIYGYIESFKKSLKAIEDRLDNHDGILAAYNNTLTALANGLAAAQKDIKANAALIDEALEDIELLSEGLAETNDAIDALALELADVQSLANSALDLAEANQGEISAIKKALDNIYTKEEVDAQTALLREMIMTFTEANKKALEAYKKEANGRLDAVEANIADLAKKHSDLTEDFKQFVNVTFEDFKDETAESIADLQGQIDDLNALLDEKVADLEGLIADTKEEIETLIADVKADLITKIATAQAEAIAKATENAKEYTDAQRKELYAQLTEEYGKAVAEALADANDYTDEIAEVLREEISDAAAKAYNDAVAKAKDNTDAAIKALYDALEAGEGPIAGAIALALSDSKAYTDAAIAALTTAYEAADAALKASIEAVDAKVDNLSKSFDAYKEEMAETLSQVDKKIAEIEENVNELYDLLEDLTAELEKLESLTAKQIKDLQDNSATKAELEARVEELKGLITEANELIQANKDALASYKAEMEKLTNGIQATIEALQADLKTLVGRVDGIDASIETINASIATINDQIKAINETIGVMQDEINALASRIQSIVYVPEYKDGAYIEKVTLNSEDLGVYATATFKVTPKECAYLFLNASTLDPTAEDNGHSDFKLLCTKDALKAASCEEIDHKYYYLEVEEDANENITGYVTVKICDQKNALKIAGKAIALAYEANTKGLENNPTGTFITSDFAAINKTAKDIELKNSYVLYNPETKTEYAAKETTVCWTEYQKETATWYPYEGYEPWFKINGEYKTIEEIEYTYNLPEGTLALTVDTPSATFDPAGEKCFSVAKNADALYSITMGSSDMKDSITKHVGHSVTVTPRFLDSNKIGVNFPTYKAKYTIGWREFTFVLDTKNQKQVDWSYKFADDHSTAHTRTNYLDKPYWTPSPLEATKPMEFAFDANQSEGIDILTPELYNDILKLTAKFQIKKGNADWADATTGQSMAMTYVSSVTGPVMNVQLNGQGSYGFGAEAMTWYYRNVYTNQTDKDATKYTFSYDVTFGAAPKDADYEIPGGILNIPFDPGKSASVSKDFGSDLSNGLFKKPNVNSVFATEADFLTALYTDNTQVAKTWYVHDNPDGTTSKYSCGSSSLGLSYINLSAGTAFEINGDILLRKGQGIRFHYGDMTKNYYNATDMFTIADYAEFETSYDTWFGPTYTVKAKARVQLPSVSLQVVKEFVEVKDGMNYVKAQGENVGGKWTISDINLNKYVKVVGDPLKNLSVQYTAVTKADDKKGIEYVPTTSKASYTVDELTLAVENGTLTWGVGANNYTGTEVVYNVSLVYNPNIYINVVFQTLPITFYTDKMVDVRESVTVTETRHQKEAATASIYSGLRVRGLDKNYDVNVENNAGLPLINDPDPEVGEYRNLAKATEWGLSAKPKYGLALEVPADFDAKDTDGKYLIKAEGFEGAPLSPSDLAGLKFKFDATNATITIEKDAAPLTCDITFYVPYQVRFDRDWKGVQPTGYEKGVVKVVFTQE